MSTTMRTHRYKKQWFYSLKSQYLSFPDVIRCYYSVKQLWRLLQLYGQFLWPYCISLLALAYPRGRRPEGVVVDILVRAGHATTLIRLCGGSLSVDVHLFKERRRLCASLMTKLHKTYAWKCSAHSRQGYEHRQQRMMAIRVISSVIGHHLCTNFQPTNSMLPVLVEVDCVLAVRAHVFAVPTTVTCGLSIELSIDLDHNRVEGDGILKAGFFCFTTMLTSQVLNLFHWVLHSNVWSVIHKMGSSGIVLALPDITVLIHKPKTRDVVSYITNGPAPAILDGYGGTYSRLFYLIV